MTDSTLDQAAAELAITDLLSAAEDLFAARPTLTQVTIERRGDGAAWVKVGEHWLTKSPRADWQ